MQFEFDPLDVHDPDGAGAIDQQGSPAPPRHLSPSGASTFEQCPRRWRFRYVECLPDPPGIHALIGTFAHRVLELLMQQPPHRRSIDDAKRIARAAWPEISESDEYGDLELDAEQSREFRWRTWDAVEGLWRLEDPAAVEVKSTEQRVSVELGGVPFRGVVDRVEVEPDGVVVSDYKSGRAPSPRFASERLRQVLLYSAAIAAETGESPVRAQLLYLGQKIVSTVVNEAELDGAVTHLQTTWNSIAQACSVDEFEPRTGPLCGYCPYSQQCPEGQVEIAKRERQRLAEEESLLKLAG